MNGLKTAILLGTLTGLLVLVGHFAGGTQGALIAFGFALAMNFVSYWWSDKIVLALHGAREVGPDEAPRLHATVDRLSGRAGIPKPRVYVMEDRSPNAFATGRNPRHAAICATTGILDILDDQELEGVLAHELGHVRNRDILISTVAASLAGAISLLSRLLFWTGGSRSRDDRESGSGGLEAIGMLVSLILAPLIAMLVQLAVSRSREYEADRTGALLSGEPEALASALEKIQRTTEVEPLATATQGTAHMFISNPYGVVRSFFSTHPPTEKRIERLLAMRHAALQQ
ncbi:zinc metalloprotease HtpX [bacterium]|nr:zinc metalloprotease HtpX [bacterium]